MKTSVLGPFEVEMFSVAKNPARPETNEDIVLCMPDLLLVADGSTAKDATLSFGDKSGGRLAAELCAEVAQSSSANGAELISQISAKFRAQYQDALGDPLPAASRRFATTLVAARLAGSELIITQVGDTSFRINGEPVHSERRIIDELDAAARSLAIQAARRAGLSEPEAIKAGRQYITPSLNNQFQYRNNPNHWLGFGYIDGGEVPDKFLKTYRFPLESVHVLEIFSDGYVEPGAQPTVAEWEKRHQEIDAEDPDRYKKYLATKPRDDRSLIIARR